MTTCRLDATDHRMLRAMKHVGIVFFWIVDVLYFCGNVQFAGGCHHVEVAQMCNVLVDTLALFLMKDRLSWVVGGLQVATGIGVSVLIEKLPNDCYDYWKSVSWFALTDIWFWQMMKIYMWIIFFFVCVACTIRARFVSLENDVA